MIPRISALISLRALWKFESRGAVMASLIFFWLFIQLADCGRHTEERLLMRLRDEQNKLEEFAADDPDQDEDPSGDRSRRQLPTEISIQVTAPLFTARLYDYGANDGDKEVPPSIDVGIKFELKQPLTFFDQKFNEIYILSNGGIGFDANARNYKSDVFHGGPMIIAPLWNRNDLRKGGKIFYREVTEGRPIERAQSEVRYQLDKNIKPISVLLVTWVHMQPMGEQNLSEDNSNTFQAAIITSDNGTFANFIYKSIGWTQGAEAGFSKGDSKNFHALPTSGTSHIMYLKDNGNTGIPGEWMFEIGQSKIIRCKVGIKGDTCDDDCAEFEWGNDCDKCCHCGKGRCNVHTGECPGECKQCWKNAPHCDKREGECKVKAKECGYNAISFTDYDHCGEAIVRCQCLSGYTGDGYNCTDVDECAKPNTCSPAANCYNTPGRYYCECQSGFSGNGTVCTPSSGGAPASVSSGGISIIAAGNARNATATPGAAGSSPPSGSTPLATTENVQGTTPSLTLATTGQGPRSGTSPGSSATITAETGTPTPAPTGTSTTPLAPGLGIQLITAATTTPSTPAPTSGAQTTSQAATQPELIRPPGTSAPAETTKPTPSKPQYPDAIQTLPKETYSQITYRLRQPLNIFGKRRDHLTISSTGLVSLDDVPPVTPDDDLDQLGISGFAPFFGKIDLGQHGAGTVTVRETSHSLVLTEATSLVENYFHAPGFMAKSVLTISFDNVTAPARQQKNNFQIVLIAGNNALGENVTYVEYVYSNLQWSEGAQAVILADSAANSVQLPGSGSDGVRQLSQLSNIDEPGQWMYRVDLERVTCPQSNLLPPYCNSDTPAPTTATSRTRPVSHAAFANATSNGTTTAAFPANQTAPSVVAGTRVRSGTTPVISFTDTEDETITFPAFVTVLPQLITQVTPLRPLAPSAGTTTPHADAGTALPVSPGSPLNGSDATEAAQPPLGVGDNASLPPVPNSLFVSASLPSTVLPPAVVTIPVPPGPSIAITPAVVIPVISNGITPSIRVGPAARNESTPAVPLGPNFNESIQKVQIGAAEPHNVPVPEPAPSNVTAPTARTGPVGPPVVPTPQTAGTLPHTVSTAASPVLVPGSNAPNAAASLPPPTGAAPPNGPIIKPLNNTPGQPQSPTIESGVVTPSAPVIVQNANADDSSPNLPPLQIFTTPRKQSRPPVPTRPPPRIVTGTQGPGGLRESPGGGRRPPPNNNRGGNDNDLQNIAGDNEELDSLNSPSKLAIIIPTAVVGVWLLLLMLIGIVVCCKRRSYRRRMRSKYDPGYHFRHMPSIAAPPRSKDAAVAAAAAAAAAASTSAQANGVYPQPHVSYEDHLEKAARLSEMSQYGQNGGRVSMYGSYWNMPSSSRPYSYYNQGYYESCPEFNRTPYYNGRY